MRPRSVGQLLDLPLLGRGHLLGDVEDGHGLRAVEVGGGEQVPHAGTSVPAPAAAPVDVPPDSMRTSSAPSTSSSATRTRSARRRREVLADVVGADRQLAVPAVDEDGEPDGPRAPEVGERVEGGTDRAPGEQHVVDEDDDLVVDPSLGEPGRGDRPDRLAAQVVAVHRRRRASRRGRADPRSRRAAVRGVRRGAPRGSGYRGGRGGRRPCSARGPRGRYGSDARRISAASSTVRRAVVTRPTSFPASRDGSLKGGGPAGRPTGSGPGVRPVGAAPGAIGGRGCATEVSRRAAGP